MLKLQHSPLHHAALQSKEVFCYAADGSLYSCGTWRTYYRAGGAALPAANKTTTLAQDGIDLALSPSSKDGSAPSVELVTAFGKGGH